MTVFVVYIVADPAELNTEIEGVYSTKEKAEAERKNIRKRLSELGNRHFMSVRIDECELD